VLTIAALSGACGGGGTPGEEPGTQPAQPSGDKPWHVGDVVTREGTDKVMETISAADRNRTAERTTTASWVEKCVEVTPAGDRARYLVHIREWFQKGEIEDESVEGADLEVIQGARGWRWSVLGTGVKPSDAGRRWLEDRFGLRRLDDEDLRRMLVKDTPEVGTSWHPDPSLLADWARRLRMDVDRAAMSGSARVVSADGGAQRIVFDAALPLTRAPETEIPWTAGGTLNLKGEAVFPVAGRPPIASSLEIQGGLEGEALRDGIPTRFTGRIELTVKTTVGGDFPVSAAASEDRPG
jgi:hypothetical protein